MSEAYNALRAGRPPVLPLVRLQYPDFAAWQIRHLASPAVQRQVRLLPRPRRPTCSLNYLAPSDVLLLHRPFCTNLKAGEAA